MEMNKGAIFMNHAKHILMFTLLFIGVAAAAEYDFYVSPLGNDSNPGTRTEPFATLDKARLAVRELKKIKQDDIAVCLGGGKYIMRETVVFSKEDSGSPTQKIRYEGFPGHEAILTSEQPVSGWKKAPRLPERFPPSAKDKVWVAPLPEGAGRIKYLFQGESVLQRSMTEGFIPPVTLSGWKGKTTEDRLTMQIPGGIISDWKDHKDMELVIMPTCDWMLYNLPLESYDPKTKKVRVAFEQYYGLGAQKKKSWKQPSAWFANCPEGMREEGNWYVNIRENRIYLVSSRKPEQISVPMLLEYIRVEGEGTRNSDSDVLVKNLHFRNLVFTKNKRFTWTAGRREIDRFWVEDVPSAAIRFVNVRECSVTGSRFEHLGSGAVRFDRAAQNNRIEGNLIKRIGGMGICISGYENGEKDVSHGNQVIGNHIHHTGEAYWAAPAIIVNRSSGNRVAHNLVHHTAYNGIRVTGATQNIRARNNVVEYNELHHVVEFLGDGNAFYITCVDSMFRYNHIHHLHSHHVSAAMRTDGLGSTKNIAFVGNVVHDVAKGGLVFKGPGHQAINNIFVDCFNESAPKSWEGEKGWLEIRAGPSDGMLIKNNIFYDTRSKAPNFVNAVFDMPDRFKHPIKLEVIQREGNICYPAQLGKTEGRELMEKINAHGFTGFDYREIKALLVKDGRLYINPRDKLFTEGYEYIDMDKIGLPETFPKAWLEYDPEMSMRKLFASEKKPRRKRKRK